ncbi:MAG: alpha/beta fold hydrolase [Gaiella sp.]
MSRRRRLTGTIVAVAALAAALLAAGAWSQSAATDVIPGFVQSAGNPEAPRTVVLVHDGPGQDRQWLFRSHRVLASDVLRVVAYDQRGAGRSRPPRAPLSATIDDLYRYEVYVADLEALRKKLGLERLDLVGHGWGGFVAAAFAAEHPRRVRTLMLVNARPLSLRDDLDGQLIAGSRRANLIRKGLVPLRAPAGEPNSCRASDLAYLPMLLASPSSKKRAIKALGPFTCSQTPRSLTEIALTERLDDRLALRRRLARYAGPALVIAGARDPYGDTWFKGDRAQLAGAKVTARRLAGTGHFPWIDGPEYLSALRGFIARTWSG